MFVRRDLTDTVPTPSGNMHFVKKGSGYPVVLLHPLGTSIWTWEGIIDSPYVRPPSLPAGETRLAEARVLWEKIKASEG